MTELLPVPGVLIAENVSSTCQCLECLKLKITEYQYLEFLKLKMTEYLPAPRVLIGGKD